MGQWITRHRPQAQGVRVHTLTADWIDHLHLTRQLPTAGERYVFFVSVARGELVALFPDVYIRASLWNAFDVDGSYRARVKAASLIAPRGTLFSHHSAAALWRLPFVGQWPTKAHVLTPRADGGPPRPYSSDTRWESLANLPRSTSPQSRRSHALWRTWRSAHPLPPESRLRMLRCGGPPPSRSGAPNIARPR